MSMHVHAMVGIMLNRRLQILLDEDRYGRLAAEADRRTVPVAVIVREAIDAAFPPYAAGRAEAARTILGAEPMAVPSPDDLRSELDELRARAAEVPADKPVVVVCQTGRRAAMGTVILGKAGVARAANLAGGRQRR